MRRWILALAACAPAVTPSPSPRGPDDAPPRETTSAPAPARPALATRPEFLECERPDGPARPLSEREAYHWMAPDFRRSTDSMHDVARSIDEAEARLASAPADGAASRHHAELRVMVAMDHLQMSDHHGAMACVGEFLRDRPDFFADLCRWATFSPNKRSLERVHEVVVGDAPRRLSSTRTSPNTMSAP
jgi:hypothetical protein